MSLEMQGNGGSILRAGLNLKIDIDSGPNQLFELLEVALAHRHEKFVLNRRLPVALGSLALDELSHFIRKL